MEDSKPENVEEPTLAGANGSADAARKEIEGLHQQLTESKNKYLYLYSDFENFKKRAFKEKLEAAKFGWENVARDLLQVFDGFERAMKHVPQGPVADGLEMVRKQLLQLLERNGVAPVQALGKSYDPSLHEAVAKAPSDKAEGTVISEELQGFTFHGRLLRPSRVIVSSGATAVN